MSFLLRTVQKQISNILSFVHRDGSSNRSGDIGVVDESDNITGENNNDNNNKKEEEKEKGDPGDAFVIAEISCLPNRDTELFEKLKELEYCYFGTLDYKVWFRNNFERRDPDRVLYESIRRIYGETRDKRSGYWKDTAVFHCMHHGKQEQESTIVARKTATPQWWWWHQQKGRHYPTKETILRDSDVRRQIKSGRKYYYQLTPCQQCQKLKKRLDDKETELLFICHKFKLAFIDGMKDEGSLSRRLLEDQSDFGISFLLKQRVADFLDVPYTYDDYGTERISEYRTIYLQSKVSRRVRLQGAI